MNKKQAKQIAKRWSAGLLFAVGADSFTEEMQLSIEDETKILFEVQIIAEKLLGTNDYIGSLDKIIDQVLGDLD